MQHYIAKFIIIVYIVQYVVEVAIIALLSMHYWNCSLYTDVINLYQKGFETCMTSVTSDKNHMILVYDKQYNLIIMAC